VCDREHKRDDLPVKETEKRDREREGASERERERKRVRLCATESTNEMIFL